VQGKYCQNCGQENVVPHETFWHMVKHFVYDITHFDSKFFDSMKMLLFKPGFLPEEYVKGKRASYLNPVKKYVFTSAIFFLIFFTFFSGKNGFQINFGGYIDTEERTKLIQRGEKELATNSANKKWEDLLIRLKDTTQKIKTSDLIKYWDDFEIINVGPRHYKSLSQYDSLQKTLPENERDGFIAKILNRKNLQWKVKYKDREDGGTNILLDVFLHKLPYMLFVSLPLFALLLKLLYIRRKGFYYADHGIFSIYHYIFTFLLLLLVFTLGKLSDKTGWGFLNTITGLLFLSGGIYLFIAMKKFYRQGFLKTFIKFLLLNITAFVMMLVLFIAFIFLSIFEM
jgi:hypothetical protein